MADKDTSTKDEIIDAVDEGVETDTTVTEDEELDSGEDEGAEDDDQSEDGDDSEDDSDEDSDEDSDDEDSDEEELAFEKRFKQIKGDTPEEYLPNLEEAYRKSSTEGKRLSTENKELQSRLDLINQAALKDPKLAEAINKAAGDGATPPTVDPALQELREERAAKMEKQYDDFVELHPELGEDEELQQELLENLSIVGEQARKQGKVASMDKALIKAWRMMGREVNSSNKPSKGNVAQTAKASASKPKTSPSKKAKPASKSKLAPEQIAYGKKMGLTEKQMLDYVNSQ